MVRLSALTPITRCNLMGSRSAKGLMGFFLLFFFYVVPSVVFGEVYLISAVVQKVLADKSVIKADDVWQHISRKWTEQWG